MCVRRVSYVSSVGVRYFDLKVHPTLWVTSVGGKKKFLRRVEEVVEIVGGLVSAEKPGFSPIRWFSPHFRPILW